MNADGLTIQQFNESAGGQVVFHIHVHVLPRWDGVALRPHTGAMEKPDVLKLPRRQDPRGVGGLRPGRAIRRVSARPTAPTVDRRDQHASPR